MPCDKVLNSLRAPSYLGDQVIRGMEGIEICSDLTLVLHFPNASIIACCHHQLPLKGFIAGENIVWGCSRYCKSKQYFRDYCDYTVKEDLMGKTGQNAVWVSKTDIKKFNTVGLIRVVDVLANMQKCSIKDESESEIPTTPTSPLTPISTPRRKKDTFGSLTVVSE